MSVKLLNNKGLTLVEVIVSSLIIAVVLAGIYASFINAKNMVALAYHQAAALAWAESGIEENNNGIAAAGMSVTYPESGANLSTVKSGAQLNVNTQAYGRGIDRLTSVVTWTE